MSESGEQAIFEAAVATGGIEAEPTLVAHVIETDGSVFVAQEWSFEEEGLFCAGGFAGTQEREVSVLIPRSSLRRIVFEAGA